MVGIRRALRGLKRIFRDFDRGFARNYRRDDSERPAARSPRPSNPSRKR